MNPRPDLPAFLDRRPLVHSYSSLSTYENVCPYKYYRQYVVRDLPYVETPARKRGNETHDALALRIGGKPLPNDMQHLEKWAAPFDGRGARAEGKVGVTRQGKPTGFFDKDVWLRGAIDVSVVQNATAMIFDWKDGASKWVKRFELDVHAVLLHARHPELKTIRAHYVFTTEDHMSEPYDCSDTRGTWQAINEIVGRIETDKAAGEFEKRRNPLCRFCECFDCQHNTNEKRNDR